MSSKTTHRHWSQARAAATAAVELAALIDTAQRELLGPFFGAAEPAPLLDTQRAVARMIAESAERLILLEDGYARTRLDQRARRTALAPAAADLHREVVDARRLLLQLYGAGRGLSLTAVGIKLKADRPVAVALFARQLVDALRQPGFAFPQPAQAVSRTRVPEPAAVADAVEAVLEPVEAALREGDLLRQHAEIDKGARDTERHRLKILIRRGLHFLAGLYRLVGHDYHADRLRAILRRRAAATTTDDNPTDTETPPAARLRLRRRKPRAGSAAS